MAKNGYDLESLFAVPQPQTTARPSSSAKEKEIGTVTPSAYRRPQETGRKKKSEKLSAVGKKCNFFIYPDLVEALRERADSEQRPVQTIVNEALRQYLK